MGQPKKQTTPRRTGNRRSHLRLKLARRVNATSPVKVATTKKQDGKRTKVSDVKQAKKTTSSKSSKPATKKSTKK